MFKLYNAKPFLLIKVYLINETPFYKLYFIYAHTSSAISFTSFNLAHCSSSVNLLPISHDAKPHCGLKDSLSKSIYSAAL